MWWPGGYREIGATAMSGRHRSRFPRTRLPSLHPAPLLASSAPPPAASPSPCSMPRSSKSTPWPSSFRLWRVRSSRPTTRPSGPARAGEPFFGPLCRGGCGAPVEEGQASVLHDGQRFRDGDRGCRGRAAPAASGSRRGVPHGALARAARRADAHEAGSGAGVAAWRPKGLEVGRAGRASRLFFRARRGPSLRPGSDWHHPTEVFARRDARARSAAGLGTGCRRRGRAGRQLGDESTSKRPARPRSA